MNLTTSIIISVVLIALCVILLSFWKSLDNRITPVNEMGGDPNSQIQCRPEQSAFITIAHIASSIFGGTGSDILVGGVNPGTICDDAGRTNFVYHDNRTSYTVERYLIIAIVLAVVVLIMIKFV